jgi:hypothetical protein
MRDEDDRVVEEDNLDNNEGIQDAHEVAVVDRHNEGAAGVCCQ